MNIKVELRPHVGKQYVPELGEEVDIEFDQYQIIIQPEGRPEFLGGYVGKSAKYTCPATGRTFDVPINWLNTVNQWPPAVVDKLTQSVQAALAAKAEGSQVDKDLLASGVTRPVTVAPDLPDAEAIAANHDDTAVDDENL